MTIPVRIRGTAGKRHAPRSPDHLFSSDPRFRVPPTGIPKPDPDEVPPDEPVITAGMPLQVDILGGKRTVMNYIMTPIQKSLATAFREK